MRSLFALYTTVPLNVKPRAAAVVVAESELPGHGLVTTQAIAVAC